MIGFLNEKQAILDEADKREAMFRELVSLLSGRPVHGEFSREHRHSRIAELHRRLGAEEGSKP